MNVKSFFSGKLKANLFRVLLYTNCYSFKSNILSFKMRINELMKSKQLLQSKLVTWVEKVRKYLRSIVSGQHQSCGGPS